MGAVLAYESPSNSKPRPHASRSWSCLTLLTPFRAAPASERNSTAQFVADAAASLGYSATPALIRRHPAQPISSPGSPT